MLVWKADNEVMALANHIKERFHLPRLFEASIAVAFNDAKPFIRNKFNWGKTQKFTNHAKLWHQHTFDFVITLSADAWLEVLSGIQREALLDLHLARCQVDYEPVVVEENGAKKAAKDQWGRVQYTDIMKLDEEGHPKWKLEPLDIYVLQDNVSRFGCWCEDLADFRQIIKSRDV